MKLTLAFLLILALAAFSACTQPADTTTPPPDTTTEAGDETALPSEPPPDTTTPEQEETEEPPATVTEEDIEAARQVVSAYWEAFNSYDVDGVLAFLEESYGQQREEDLRDEIGQMQTFGVTLGVEEEAEPVVTADGKIEIKMKIDVPMPMPDRHVTYQLIKVNSEWKICSAEE